MKWLLFGLLVLGLVAASCQAPRATGTKSIVVTYSVMESLVKELVGDEATVTVSIPNGLDPHEWQPSVKDIQTIDKADLVVENGLGLETGMLKALEEAKSRGVRVFTATDHIDVRHVGAGEGVPAGDVDQAAGAADPHLWTDPLAIKAVVHALAPELSQVLGTDVSRRASDLESQLDVLNTRINDMVSTIPTADRKLVTGHESMGYFADRYGFRLVGVIIPGLSSQAEVSPADLAALQKAIESNHVKAIFTEIGTSPAVARAIGDATGARVVELNTHTLPADGSYFTFMRELAGTIVGALK